MLFFRPGFLCRFQSDLPQDRIDQFIIHRSTSFSYVSIIRISPAKLTLALRKH